MLGILSLRCGKESSLTVVPAHSQILLSPALLFFSFFEFVWFVSLCSTLALTFADLSATSIHRTVLRKEKDRRLLWMIDVIQQNACFLVLEKMFLHQSIPLATIKVTVMCPQKS